MSRRRVHVADKALMLRAVQVAWYGALAPFVRLLCSIAHF